MADIEDIKKLREMTGAGYMTAKDALEEAGGIDQAIKVLRKKGVATAAKKADREAREGIIEAYAHGGKIGVVVEINCETDFVARTDDFKNFAHDVAMHIAASEPEDVAGLLRQPFIKDLNQTVEQLMQSLVAKLGENIVIRRFSRVELGEK